MPSDKLTELGIKKSKSGKKEKKLYDGQGLYLLLHPNGSKYWRVRYRFFFTFILYLDFFIPSSVSLSEGIISKL